MFVRCTVESGSVFWLTIRWILLACISVQLKFRLDRIHGWAVSAGLRAFFNSRMCGLRSLSLCSPVVGILLDVFLGVIAEIVLGWNFGSGGDGMALLEVLECSSCCVMS